MQECSNCHQLMIIGITADVYPPDAVDPDIMCRQCGQILVPNGAIKQMSLQSEYCMDCGTRITGVNDAGGGLCVDCQLGAQE